MNSSQRGNPDPGTPDDPPAGKGMPAKEPRAQRSRPGKQDTLKDGAVEARLMASPIPLSSKPGGMYARA
jgi:hypothetical protein